VKETLLRKWLKSIKYGSWSSKKIQRRIEEIIKMKVNRATGKVTVTIGRFYLILSFPQKRFENIAINIAVST
jgi:hypothetical protein